MSNFNRKGFTTIKAQGGHGGIRHFAVPAKSRLARIAKTKNKQMERMRKQHISQYKKDLREAKKKVPLAERSKIRLQDL